VEQCSVLFHTLVDAQQVVVRLVELKTFSTLLQRQMRVAENRLGPTDSCGLLLVNSQLL
jgi:hypothetical protein